MTVTLVADTHPSMSAVTAVSRARPAAEVDVRRRRARRAVLALGARRLPDPPDAGDFRVYADPAGHPFCLVFNI